jgi:membrane protein insertase Oxa1/YidC/SpoIIIJ
VSFPKLTSDLTDFADTQMVLGTLEGGLAAMHVPYSNGWSIIALTAVVKLATFPFTKIQVRPVLAP